MAEKTERSEAEARAERAERQAKNVIKSLPELSPEILEDLTIGSETELAQRELPEKGAWTHIATIKDDIDEAYKMWGKVSGISTGYPRLDSKIGGLKDGEIILIGGETNQGKSALAQNIAVNVSKTHKVGFITLEMLKAEAGSRLMHMNGGTVEGMDVLFQTDYQIDYRHLEPLFENAIKDGAKLVILDYLQYMGRGMTLDEVSKMSKLMKALALKYKVPFIVIVSLRKSGQGKEKRPWTSIETDDLMGAGAIGYDADVALIASRKSPENEFVSDKFFVKVVKARNMEQDYNDRYIAFDWDKTRIKEIPEYDWIPDESEIKDPQQGQLPYKD